MVQLLIQSLGTAPVPLGARLGNRFLIGRKCGSGLNCSSCSHLGSSFGPLNFSSLFRQGRFPSVSAKSNLHRDVENPLFLHTLDGKESSQFDTDLISGEDFQNLPADKRVENVNNRSPSEKFTRNVFQYPTIMEEELEPTVQSSGEVDATVLQKSQLAAESKGKQELEQAVAGVVVERGDWTGSRNSSSAGESEPIEGTREDLLVEFLEKRTKNAGDGKTRKIRVTTRSTPVKQKHEPNLPPEQEYESESVRNLFGLVDSDQRLSAEMPLPDSQGALARFDDGIVTGEFVEDVLRLAKSLPENRSLEEFLRPLHGKVSAKEGNEVLKALGAEQMTWPLLSFFQWMRLQSPCLLDPRSFCIVFTYLGKVGRADQAQTLYRNLPSSSKFHAVQVYNALLAALARCNRGDSIATVLQDMKDRKVERDTVTFSILITATEKEMDRLQKLWSLFEDMLANAVTPDVALFGSLIKAFCDGGHHKQASVIAVSMEKMGIMPNVMIYNTLIDAYGKAGQLEEAEGLLAELSGRGLQPTTSTCNCLINGYAKQGQFEVAEELILDMPKQGLKPDVFTYTSLISAYGKQKLTEKAVNVFLRMRKKGIFPTTHTYTALINAYSEGGWHDRAEVSFANMQREGLKPTVETYTALLDGYRRAGMVDKVLHVWKAMKEGGCKLTPVTYNTLMDAFAKQGRFNEARDVMAEMRSNDFEPDLMTYNMLLNAYGRGGLQSKFPKVLREMKIAGYEPDSFTYCTLIYASLRIRDFTSAFQWEREMSERGQRPDPKTYSKMKHILNAKFKEKQENDRKAALGQLKSLRKKARKNPQRLKTFKKEITELIEGPLLGHRRPKKTVPTRRQTEKDKALWKRDDDDLRYP